MSHTFVGAPIAAALVQSEDFIGPERPWTAINSEQESFLQSFVAARAELSRFTSDELRAWASRDASELNAILEREGFAIRVPELGRDDFGVVSILDVLVEWLREGDRTEITCEGSRYPAVRLDSFTVVNSPAIPTRSPCCPRSRATGSAWLLRINSGFRPLGGDRGDSERAGAVARAFESLVFPMVDLDQQVELEWIVGMRTTDLDGRPVVITYGAQQTKLRMNVKGAHAESRPRSPCACADAAGSNRRPGHRPAVLLLDRA